MPRGVDIATNRDPFIALILLSSRFCYCKLVLLVYNFMLSKFLFPNKNLYIFNFNIFLNFSLQLGLCICWKGRLLLCFFNIYFQWLIDISWRSFITCCFNFLFFFVRGRHDEEATLIISSSNLFNFNVAFN